MKREHLVLLVAILVAAASLFATFAYGSQEELLQIQKALKEKGDPWVAAMNPKSELPKDVRRRLCGTLRPDESQIGPLRAKSFYPLNGLPDHFDWRDNGGNWVTPIRDQGNCGSCWDFAATAAVESGTIIKHNRAGYDYDLSEQHILSCANAGSCNGGYHYKALNYYISNGSPDEDCFPYEADDSLPCSETCSDWQSRAQKINDWDWVTYSSADVETIKAAVYQYPVCTTMDVYTDFFYYNSGIYEYAWGSYQGGHAVLIVGWDDDEQYWIAKNSWDTTWGEDGFFRIKWGEVEFGYYSILVDPSDDLAYIEMDYLVAEPQGSDILIMWQTGAELDNAGFLVYRWAEGATSYELISGLIEPKGTPASGDSYSFLDSDVSPGVWYSYWVVDIDTKGTWTAHGPAKARVGFDQRPAPGPARLPSASATPASFR